MPHIAGRAAGSEAIVDRDVEADLAPEAMAVLGPLAEDVPHVADLSLEAEVEAGERVVTAGDRGEDGVVGMK